MALYTHKVISTADISSNRRYAFHLGPISATLLDSVRRKGVLQPLIVTPDAYEVISGYRRLEIARKLEIPALEVLVLNQQPSSQDGFLLALLSNWQRPFSDLEKALIMVSAKDQFLFEETEIFSEIFPALNMQKDKSFYQEALEVLKLDDALLQLIRFEKLPFRGAKILLGFNLQDQRSFAVLAEHAAFTTNQLLKVGEWLYDLFKLSGLSLASFLRDNQFDRITGSDLPRNLKGEKIFLMIRALRFPGVAEKEARFLALSPQVREGQSDLSVDMPPFFESEGLILKARLKNRDSLETVTERIESKRKVLNSLLDIVL